MVRRGDSATAFYVDEYTVYVGGVLFHREDAEARGEDEVLLQPTNKAVAPRLRCSNCHFERGYAFWYKRIGFVGRQIEHCPGCGFKIIGVVGHAEEGR